MEDFLHILAGCTIFSKIDLWNGGPLNPRNLKDIHKTAKTIPKGLSEYTRMPFRLSNLGNTFQLTIYRVKSGLEF